MKHKNCDIENTPTKKTCSNCGNSIDGVDLHPLILNALLEKTLSLTEMFLNDFCHKVTIDGELYDFISPREERKVDEHTLEIRFENGRTYTIIDGIIEKVEEETT